MYTLYLTQCKEKHGLHTLDQKSKFGSGTRNSKKKQLQPTIRIRIRNTAAVENAKAGEDIGYPHVKSVNNPNNMFVHPLFNPMQ